MSCLAACENIFVLAKGLHIDYFNFETHSYLDVEQKLGNHEDYICDITISPDNNYMALITSVSKQLIVFSLPQMKEYKIFKLPRSASKIRFSANNGSILVADKSGDVLIYDLKSEDTGFKLLGHLSLLLDVLQTNDMKYIITSDRDEKIRVSKYPNTYNIETYCLGHKEFVNHIEILPHNNKFLTSSSGDGAVKCWDYQNGTLHHTIDVYLDVDAKELSENFVKIMDEEGVDVSILPIVHYAITKLSEDTSLIAVAVHSYNKILLYRLQSIENQFKHQKEETITVENFPAALMFLKNSLILYDDTNCIISIMSIIINNDKINLEIDRNIKMFQDKDVNFNAKLSLESIKVLYKRKFDNVQEYQERKKQRMEKSIK